MSKRDINATGTSCDYCKGLIPDYSTNIVIAKFRIGSHEKHDFLVHQTCIMDKLRAICSEEM
jgi:hypothetical protein